VTAVFAAVVIGYLLRVIGPGRDEPASPNNE
jgi:hypothetical protein